MLPLLRRGRRISSDGRDVFKIDLDFLQRFLQVQGLAVARSHPLDEAKLIEELPDGTRRGGQAQAALA